VWMNAQNLQATDCSCYRNEQGCASVRAHRRMCVGFAIPVLEDRLAIQDVTAILIEILSEILNPKKCKYTYVFHTRNLCSSLHLNAGHSVQASDFRLEHYRFHSVH
jgi:hypothetical protein